jgi:membrane peptidoglycan carboxypeptidase
MSRSGARPRRLWRRLLLTGLVLGATGALGWGLYVEARSSPLQARLFTRLTAGFAVVVEPGASPAIRFPAGGPYDARLGYARIPAFLRALEPRGFTIERQARLSPGLVSFIDWGGFPVYPEKSHAGLVLLDRTSATLYRARYPERVLSTFESIPQLVVASLLFIENRTLLEASAPTRNPAVEWSRLAAAGVNTLAAAFLPTGQRFGGSTLATQVEKYRHSLEGRTASAAEKLRQVLSASARAYQDGPDTSEARRRIVLDYVNSTPLSARPGFGEVIGLGDGLHVWFGTDLEEAVARLSTAPASATDAARRAEIYRQVLALLLAQRRPSHYLLAGREDLARLTDAHLRLLAQRGIITPELRDAALAQPLAFRPSAPAPASRSFVEHKGLNAMRAELLSLLQVESLYTLDRLDLRVQASLDAAAQEAVTATLRRLAEPEGAKQAGLFGERLLRGDPAGVAYSVTLYERAPDGNRVRVQADNLERPLDLNEGGKFDLGSTAKLRTLTTYLEIVAELHERYATATAAELREVLPDASDPLTRWAVGHLAGAADRSLAGLVEAALQRRYSANPAETFFTGRGAHRFANFDDRYTGVLTVREAFRHSVNLVFVRMMRDIVKYYQADGPDPVHEVLTDAAHPARREYLERFADLEGRLFLDQFYRRYATLAPDPALELLASRARPVPHRLATVFRSVRPQAPVGELAGFVHRRLPTASLTAQEAQGLYDKYGPERFNLHDRGYIAKLHPLELWLVAYLQTHPGASRSEVMAASAEARQEVYQWLFKSRRKGAADTRIRIVAEEDAFRKVHGSWQRQGYPFASLVPSLATAIGSSADRPAALAELVGIILNDGVRLPTVRIEALDLAESTPYETHLVRRAAPGERVLPEAVARALRAALADVVAQGTARRLAGAFTDAMGQPLEVGGKTGTGDELADRYGPGTEAGKGKEVSRSAAFAFFLGDRFFGVVTAHVPGSNAGRYRFTSALPTQVLKALEPALAPLVRGGPPAASATAGQAQVPVTAG